MRLGSLTVPDHFQHVWALLLSASTKKVVQVLVYTACKRQRKWSGNVTLPSWDVFNNIVPCLTT